MFFKKTQPEEFDLVILGGGTGSTIAAWTFAGEGKRVAVVDRKYIGGVVATFFPLEYQLLLNKCVAVNGRRLRAADKKAYEAIGSRKER